MRLAMSSSDYALTTEFTVSKLNLDSDRLYVFTLTRSSDTYNFYFSLSLSQLVFYFKLSLEILHVIRKL